MLFFRALLMLVAYDVLRTFSTFGRIHNMVKHWTVARRSPDADTINRVCRAVNYACIWYPKQVLCLQCAFVTTYLLRKKGILHIWSWAHRNSHSRLMPGSKSMGGLSMRDRMSRRLMRFGTAASQGSR